MTPLTNLRSVLAHYLRPQKGRVIWLAVFIFANIALQLLNPQIMRRFLDLALATGNSGTEAESLSAIGDAVQSSVSNQLLWMGILFIGVALLQQGVSVLATYLSERVGWDATNGLRYDLAQHCLTLDMSFHNQHTPGELIERIDGDINTLSKFFSQFVLQVLGNAILLIGILVFIWIEDIQIGLATTVVVAGMIAGISYTRSLAVPFWKEASKANATLFSFLEERLAGTEEIRASGAKAYVIRRFTELWRTIWQAQLKASMVGFSVGVVGTILLAVATATIFVMGSNRYFAGDMSLGAIYVLVHYTTMMSMPVRRIVQEIDVLQKADAGMARIRELLQIESKLPMNSNMGIPARVGHSPNFATSKGTHTIPPQIEFENVSFGYEDTAETTDRDERVLKDISFTLEPGQALGLLGRTGSGKTTITRLLLRFYDPQEGHISLNGYELRDLPLTSLRQQVGIVTQNVQLFHASIRDNLTFFDDSVDDDRIIKVLDELGLNSWLSTQEAGLDTVLAAGGGGLSAGEAQLLAFARIFLRKPEPGLVILDEASSRLDPATEQLLEQAITKLLENRTAIIIAHRLSTVERTDAIMVLDNGQIIEHGPRLALANDPSSHFYGLLQTGLLVES